MKFIDSHQENGHGEECKLMRVNDDGTFSIAMADDIQNLLHTIEEQVEATKPKNPLHEECANGKAEPCESCFWRQEIIRFQDKAIHIIQSYRKV